MYTQCQIQRVFVPPENEKKKLKTCNKTNKEKNFNEFFFICMESNDISNNKKYGTL